MQRLCFSLVTLAAALAAGVARCAERPAPGKKPLSFYGRTGGIVPSPEEVTEQIKKLISKRKPKAKKRA